MAVALLAAEPLLRQRRPGVWCGELPGEHGAGHAGLTAAQTDLSPGPRAGLQPHEHALSPSSRCPGLSLLHLEGAPNTDSEAMW